MQISIHTYRYQKRSAARSQRWDVVCPPTRLLTHGGTFRNATKRFGRIAHRPIGRTSAASGTYVRAHVPCRRPTFHQGFPDSASIPSPKPQFQMPAGWCSVAHQNAPFEKLSSDVHSTQTLPGPPHTPAGKCTTGVAALHTKMHHLLFSPSRTPLVCVSARKSSATPAPRGPAHHNHLLRNKTARRETFWQFTTGHLRSRYLPATHRPGCMPHAAGPR
jgi:hypothetical protein